MTLEIAYRKVLREFKMLKTLPVFISSKMRELHAERQALEVLLPTLGDDTTELRPWIFESDAPASDSSIRSTYLKALSESALYIGLFWNELGEWTVDEFHRAGELGIPRHIYVKNVDLENRDERLVSFLDRHSDVRFGVTPRWFTDIDDLKRQVSHSIDQWLLERQVAYHSATTAIIAREPDDIPELPRKLIGRDDLVRDVYERLEDNERVLLRGFGGSGKSALAATLAADYMENTGRDIIWIRAGSASADAIFESLGRAFDVQHEIVSAQGDERLQKVRRLLNEQQSLPVLDDVWNGAALAQVVKAIPRKLPLLVTSRQRFPMDEIVEVGELKPDQALQLLVYHARRREIENNPHAAQLCELLGYHAFALEIAGKLLKVHGMELAELLRRIENMPHDLDMPAGFGELGRTGIKAILETSVNALERETHAAYITLGSMFEPTATPELVALTLQRPQTEITQDLEHLEQHGLVKKQKYKYIPYYRTHDLAYSYARSLFLNKGSSQLPVLEACSKLAVAHKDNLDLLDIEQSNLIEAADSAKSLGRDDILLEIMQYLALEGPYFAARGHTAQSLALLEVAVDTASRNEEFELAHYLWGKLGNTYLDFYGNLDRALDAYQKSLRLAQQLQNPRRQAMLLTAIGSVRFRQKADDADGYYVKAEQIARAHNDEFALCFVLHHRGNQLMNMETPDYEASRQLSDEAAQIAEQLGHHELYTLSLINRGGCELELGLMEEALTTHRQALQQAESQGNYAWMAYALQSIGEDLHHMNERGEAQAALDRSLSLWRQIGSKAQEAALVQFMEERQYKVESR